MIQPNYPHLMESTSTFRALLEEYAHKHGEVGIHLTEPWKGGDRFFLVERTLIFDVKNWGFVGWVKPNHHLTLSAFPQSLSTLPNIVRCMVLARGWQRFLLTHIRVDLLSIVQKNHTHPQSQTPKLLFPLYNEEREVADNYHNWVYLTERKCWINRDLERCACSLCYPQGLREPTDYSVVQLNLGHCVYCTCEKCQCPLSQCEHNPSLTLPLVSPQSDCTCSICTLSNTQPSQKVS